MVPAGSGKRQFDPFPSEWSRRTKGVLHLIPQLQGQCLRLKTENNLVWALKDISFYIYTTAVMIRACDEVVMSLSIYRFKSARQCCGGLCACLGGGAAAGAPWLSAGPVRPLRGINLPARAALCRCRRRRNFVRFQKRLQYGQHTLHTREIHHMVQDLRFTIFRIS